MCVCVGDESGMKALGTADQEDVFRDVGFHGDRTTWVGIRQLGDQLTSQGALPPGPGRGGQGLLLRRRDSAGEFQVLDPNRVA